MKNFKYNLMNLLRSTLTLIGGLFFLSVSLEYMAGFDNIPMVSKTFLAGKTIPEAYFKTLLAMAAVSIVSGFSSSLFQKREWSFAKRSIIVFGISIIAFFIMLYYLKILTYEYIPSVFISLLIFCFLYAIFWFRTYKESKRDIEKINQAIKNGDL